MYETYYRFAEKPFSLTPDPKFLYRSESHANAFDLLQYAIERREGFVVITGDIGTGKTTLCRALLDQVDRATVTALVLNPFLSEEDLLKRILLDFGVVSRDELKNAIPETLGKSELIDRLHDFLVGLSPRKSAVLIIDEAQNLPLQLLEQLRILSNLETDKEKLLQIILVGQLNLKELLRSSDLRQLDQRISIRYELQPLDRSAVAAYVIHRLAVAGGSGSVSFSESAFDDLYRLSGGIPRLINLISDRALLAGYSVRARRITSELVIHAAQSLDMRSPHVSRLKWSDRRASPLAGAAAVLLAVGCAVGATAYLYERFAAPSLQASHQPVSPYHAIALPRSLPEGTAATILAGSFSLADPTSAAAVESLTARLEAVGYKVYYAEVDLLARGKWLRVLAGAFNNADTARVEASRLSSAVAVPVVSAVSAGLATGIEP
jgi:general secretion pathway protein A